jgi:hypothetical protein
VEEGTLRKFDAAVGQKRPQRAGLGPRIALLAPFACALVAACSNDASDQVTLPTELGMTSKLAAYYSDENLTMYEVETPVALPVRMPKASDLQSLGAAPKGTPYPRAPYLLASDESVEVHYTISNLDDQQTTVWMLVDPWNEFVRYDPGVQVVDDDVTSPNFGYDLAFVVPAKSRIEGTLTTDDMQEIAIKLASVMNLLASPQAMAGPNNENGFDATSIANNIFNPQNRSNSNDPLYTPWIPPVIAGLTGFDLGLRFQCTDTCTPPDVAIEVTLDVEDMGRDRFVPQDSNDPKMPEPTTVLSPPAARF